MTQPNLTQEQWEHAVIRSARSSMDAEEFEAKVNPVATRKIAYYLRYTGYEIEFLDDTTDEEPNDIVKLFFDFMAFTEGVGLD